MGIACYKSRKSLKLPDKREKTSISSLPSLPPPPPPPPPPPSVTESILTESLPDGITLIWLDAYANDSTSEDTKLTLYYLRQLNVASIRSYSDINSCLNFLKLISSNEKIQSSKIFLITSGGFALEILSKLKLISIIDSVFIFCMNKTKYIHLITEYKPLLIDICTNILHLYNSIDEQQNTTTNLTKDSASFIWFQVFQMIISELKCTQNDMNLMLTYCSKQLENDSKIKEFKRKKYLIDIEKFRQTYKKDDAIRWYTKESFVYNLLNRALRTEDIESLYIFRYFLADLCRQIKLEHKKFRLKQIQTSTILKLYRGARIPSVELKNFEQTINNLISLNGFISTSMKESIAIEFLEKQTCQIDHNEKVLFIFEIDLQCEDIIYTHVGEMSAQKDEDEVLFNMGSAFYLKKVLFDNEKQIWNVYMTATDDGIKVASEYIELTRQELNETNVSVVFGQLFLQMGNYPKAHKYFSELLKQSKPTDSDFSSICYHLALTDGYQGNLQAAEDRLNELLQSHILHQSTHLDLTRIKTALGWIYHYNGELDDAMYYYEDALKYAEQHIELNHLINAQICSFLGDCYLEKLEIDDAEMYYRQALYIEIKHLPIDHPRIGVTYNDIGNVYRKRNNMDKALEYYEKAERIFHEKLPACHPHTAYCWSCMGFIYLYYDEKEKAQEYHRKALKIYQKILPINHINIKMSEKNSKCTDFQIINDSYVKICAQI